MKKVLSIIFTISLLVTGMYSADSNTVINIQSLKKLLEEADKVFLKKDFTKAREIYKRVLDLSKANRIELERQTINEIMRDITDIDNINDFFEIEKHLKDAKTAFNEKKNEQAMEFLLNTLNLIKKHEKRLTQYKNINFFNEAGYITYLLGQKIESVKSRGISIREIAKKSLVVVELLNKSGDPNSDFYSQSLPRSIQNVLNREGGYEIIRFDNHRSSLKSREQDDILKYFKEKKIELIVFGNFDVSQDKKITISLKVVDSLTGNNVANAIVEGRTGTDVFEAVDKISAELDKALIDYSRNTFFQTLVFRLTGDREIETTRVIRAAGVYGYDKFINDINQSITDNYKKIINELNNISNNVWNQKKESEDYVIAAHKIPVIEKKYKSVIKIGKEFLDIDENEERVKKSYKKIVQIPEIERLIEEKKFDEAEALIDKADSEIDRLKKTYPMFESIGSSTRWSYYAKRISLRQNKGFQFQIHVKFGYYFPIGLYDERTKMRYPYGGLEFRFPIVMLTHWLHINIGAETGVWGVRSRAQEPTNMHVNPPSGDFEDVYRMYHIPLIANLFFKFLPLNWLHFTTSFGFGVAFHRLDVMNGGYDLNDKWVDIAMKISSFLKIGFEVQFRILTGLGISLQFSYMQSGTTKFHDGIIFGVRGDLLGSAPYIARINKDLQRESFSLWMISLGVFFGF